MPEESRPLFLTGKVVEKPELISRYYEELQTMGASHEHMVPTREVLELIRRKATERASLADVLREVEPMYEALVVDEAALRAVSACYGVKTDASVARRLVARALAEYAVEVAEALGYVIIRKGA